MRCNTNPYVPSVAELRCSRAGGREKQKQGDELSLLVMGEISQVDVERRGSLKGMVPSPPPFQVPELAHMHFSGARSKPVWAYLFLGRSVLGPGLVLVERCMVLPCAIFCSNRKLVIVPASVVLELLLLV